MSKKIFIDEYVNVWKRYTFEIPDDMDPDIILSKLSNEAEEPLDIEDSDSEIEFIEAEYLDETESKTSESAMEVYNAELELVGYTK